MEAHFAWKIIPVGCFSMITRCEFGNPPREQPLSEWNSIYEDLEIIVSLEIADADFQFEKYLITGETASWMMRWKGDNKFSGCSTLYSFDGTSSVTMRCKVSKGTCSTSFSAECVLISKPAVSGGVGNWSRPPGSIIYQISITDKIAIDRGTIFPLLEYDGQGKHLIQWDFSLNEDLEGPSSSAFMVLIDRRHPFIAGRPITAEIKAHILLVVIQQFVQKGLTPSFLDQLSEMEDMEGKWKGETLGEALTCVLRRVSDYLGIGTVKGLSDLYRSRPELINQCIDEIYSAAIKSQINE